MLAVAAALVAARLLLAVPFDIPLQVDELGYLGNARYLANGSGLVATAGRAPYKVGYPLLLVPAARLCDGRAGPLRRAAQLVNAILAAAMIPLGVWLGSRLRPRLAFADLLAAATCVALYPALSLYATTAMAFNLLATGYLAYLCLARAATAAAARPLPWLLWGTVAGALYVAHERALPWLGTALVAALAAATKARRWQPLLLLPAAIATSGLQLVVTVPGGAYDTAGTAVTTIATALRATGTLVATACGQPWYLWLATGGLLVTGLTAAVTGCRGADRLRGPGLFWWAVTGSAVGTCALSVLHMAHRQEPRFTHWIYGRYNESVVAGILLIALLALAGGTPAQRARTVWRGSAVALAGLAALTLPLRLLWTPRIGPPFGFNAIATCFYDLVIGWGLLRAAALAASVALALALAYGRSWRLGLVATSALFVAMTAAAGHSYWLPKTRDRSRERQLVRVVHEIAPARRHLDYDRRDWPSFYFYNNSFLLPDWSLAVADVAHDAHPVGDLVVSSRRDLGSAVPGARLVGLERLPSGYPPYIQGLWVRPGSLADTLAARGWLMPAAFPCRLDEADLAARLELAGLADGARITSGAAIPLELWLEHRGSAPWPDRHGWRRRAHTVAVALRWHPADDHGASTLRLLELPRMLYPGEHVRLPAVAWATADDGSPLPPGAYHLVVSVAQRNQAAVPVDGPVSLTRRVVIVAAATSDPGA